MTARKLLLDLGASRLKAALFDPDRQEFDAHAELPAPTPLRGASGEVEVDPWAHMGVLEVLLQRLPTDWLVTADAAFVCSEMHGFILVDGAGKPLTPYISWRDERASQGPASVFGRLHQTWAHRFRVRTGMRLRSGTPFVTVAYLAAIGDLNSDARFMSLPEWIACASGSSSAMVHESMAAGSGFYNLDDKSWDDELISVAGLSGSRAFGEVVADPATPLGRLKIGDLDIPLFGGLGDMQCALLGSLLEDGEACLNLGTGSQVALLSGGVAVPPVELRPFPGGRRLHTLTHIPAGRALNVFSDFVDSVADAAGGRRGMLWDTLMKVSAEEADASSLKVDLNVFNAAWRFDGGGGLAGVREAAFDLRGLGAGLVKELVNQYVEAIALLDPDRSISRFVLAGGLAPRIPAFTTLLARQLGVAARPSGSQEETLKGLSLVARGQLAAS